MNHPKMTYYVSGETLNLTHSLTRYWPKTKQHNAQHVQYIVKRLRRPHLAGATQISLDWLTDWISNAKDKRQRGWKQAVHIL